MTGNDVVKFFLQTPLHLFLGNTMLITVTGWKTGRQYSTPVGFYRENGCLWVMTSRERTWWRNVQNGAHVALLLKGNHIDAFAKAEMDEGATESRLEDYIRHVPMAAKSLGIRIVDKNPCREDISRLGKEKLFVKVVLPR